MAYIPTPYKPMFAGSTVRETKCKSCGASIAFIRLTSGKYNPVDPESHTTIKPDPTGNPWVTTYGAVIWGRPDPDGDIQAYLSHFASCPEADRHRKKKRKKG